jgi:hypothetical protein
MTSREFTQWVAYSRVEPFGHEMENWRAGMIASAIVNTLHAVQPRAKGTRGPKPLKPRDFYPPSAAKEQQTPLTQAQAEHLRKQRNGKRRHSNG